MDIAGCKTQTKDDLGEFTISEKLLGWKNKLKVHLRKNPDEKLYVCDFCSKIFSCMNDLTLHMNLHHNVEKSYECGTCMKRFAQKKYLLSHLRIHNEEKPFQCTECSKKFITLRELTIHASLHIGEKPFKCDNCLVRFRQKDNMLAHVRAPLKEKRFICKICKKKFKRCNNLTVHSKIHPGYKPFECDICSKKFAAKGMLNKHKTVHARKTLKCRKEIPPNKAKLINHMEMHAENKSLIRCDTCPRMFNITIVAIRHSKLQCDELNECDFFQKAFTTDILEQYESPVDCEVDEEMDDEIKLKEEFIIDDNTISEFNTQDRKEIVGSIETALDIQPLQVQCKTEIDSVNIEQLTVKLEKETD